MHRAWLWSILSFQLRKGPRQRKFRIGRGALSSQQCSLMNPACLARLTLIQVLPLLLNHVLKTGGGLQGRTETRMCLLLKATDAKPKHSFSRLQRLLQTSIAECLQLDEPKHPFFLRLMHTKLFFLPLLSKFKTICILSRILLSLLLLYFWQPRAWMLEMEPHPAHHRASANRDNAASPKAQRLRLPSPPRHSPSPPLEAGKKHKDKEGFCTLL